MDLINYAVFEVDNNRYLYDTNTNKIVEVSIECFQALNALGNCASIEQLNRTLPIEFLRSAHECGVLQPSRFVSVSPPIENLADTEQRLSEGPESLVLIVTEDCDLRCKYCVYGEGNYNAVRVHTSRKMEHQIAIRATHSFLSQQEHHKQSFVCFYGGEPLLRWQLIENVLQSVTQDLSVSPQWFISTNGTALTEDKFATLVQNRVMVRVSLDGPQEVHDKNRVDVRGRPTFDRVIKNLKRLRDYDLDYYHKYVSISFVVADPENLDTVNHFFKNDAIVCDIPKVCSQINNKELLNQGLTTNMRREMLGKQRRQYTKHLTTSGRKSRDHPFNFWWAKYIIAIRDREIRSLQPNERMRSVCVPGSHRVVVHPSGKYSFCIQGAEGIQIGNAETGIDAGKVLKILTDISNVLSRFCPKCWCSRFCPICPAYFSDDKGEFSEELLVAACKDIRNHIKSAFEAFIYIAKTDEKALQLVVPSEELLLS